MNILSIQSHVAYGHVGNASSVFALQRLGHEVWPVHTVQFSNHPGHGGYRGMVLPPAHIADVITGLGERGMLGRCDAVLSGYLGTAETGAAALAAVAWAMRENPDAVYACDPVIGDHGRIYVAADLAGFFRERAVPAATVMTPNAFELSLLTGIEPVSLAEARRAIAALRARGPAVVLLTSLTASETPVDSIDVLAGDASGLWLLRAPRLDRLPNGAGDLIAALFTAHWHATRSAALALSRAASSVHGILARTVKAGEREMLLIAAQDEILKPSRVLEAVKL